MKKKIRELPRLVQFQIADVSTRHITSADNDLLTKFAGKSSHPQIVLEYAHGYLVSTWHWMPNFSNEAIDDELKELGFSEAYINLMNLAAATGNKWCCLDSDGEDYPFLPEYDW
jgi:hypothetical protein